MKEIDRNVRKKRKKRRKVSEGVIKNSKYSEEKEGK